MANILQKLSHSGTGFKVSFIGILVACLIHIVGSATEYWSSGEEIIDSFSVWGNTGLWRGCACFRIYDENTCVCSYHTEDSVAAWVKAVRAMETLGLICIVFAICGAVWPHKRKSIQVIRTLLIGGAGVTILIGVVVYLMKLPAFNTINYSFWLCCCSGGICIILAPPMCDETTDTLTTTNAVSSELPATIDGQTFLRATRCVGDRVVSERSTGHLPTAVRLDRPSHQATREHCQLHPTPRVVLARLESRGINFPADYTLGDEYLSGKQIAVIANTQKLSGVNIATQHACSDTGLIVDTMGQFDGNIDTRDC